ncbi:MAG: type II secretion system F family protein [Candidatus Micrarchaeota archaeon]
MGPAWQYFRSRLPHYFVASILASAVAFAAFRGLAADYLLIAYSAAAALLLVPALEEYAFSRRVRGLELGLPSALFRMTSAPPGAPFEKLLCEAASCGGETGSAFARVSAMAGRGVPAARAFAAVSAEYGSPAFSRASRMLVSLHESGGQLSRAVHGVAEDAGEMLRLSEEGAALASLQKYTLLAAAALLLPFILGSLIQSSASLASLDGAAPVPPAFFLACQLYLFLFSALSSCFVALQEGNIKKAGVYLCIVAPFSLLVFRAVAGARVFA